MIGPTFLQGDGEKSLAQKLGGPQYGGGYGNASNFGLGGMLMSGFTGLPGLGLAGAGIGTAMDRIAFGRTINPNGYSGFSHFGNAVTGGLFGKSFREQALEKAKNKNPYGNPVDVLTGNPNEAPERGGSSRSARDRSRDRASSGRGLGGSLGGRAGR